MIVLLFVIAMQTVSTHMGLMNASAIMAMLEMVLHVVSVVFPESISPCLFSNFCLVSNFITLTICVSMLTS